MSRTGNFFIIMRTDLADEPEVIWMADQLRVREEVVVGYLHAVWSWVSQHCRNETVDNVTLDTLGRRLKLEGFPQLMEKIGWLKEYRRDDGMPVLTIPNFDKWFGGKEYRKKQERERKREYRAKQKEVLSQNCPTNVRDMSQHNIDIDKHINNNKVVDVDIDIEETPLKGVSRSIIDWPIDYRLAIRELGPLVAEALHDKPDLENKGNRQLVIGAMAMVVVGVIDRSDFTDLCLNMRESKRIKHHLRYFNRSVQSLLPDGLDFWSAVRSFEIPPYPWPNDDADLNPVSNGPQPASAR